MLFAMISKVRKKRKNLKINLEGGRFKEKRSKSGRSPALLEYLAGLRGQLTIYTPLQHNLNVTPVNIIMCTVATIYLLNLTFFFIYIYMSVQQLLFVLCNMALAIYDNTKLRPTLLTCAIH